MQKFEAFIRSFTPCAILRLQENETRDVAVIQSDVITVSLRNGRVAGTSGALKRKTGKSFLIFLIPVWDDALFS